MAVETWRTRRLTGRPGLLTSAVAVAAALANFVESRLELFASESKTVLAQMLVLIACVMAAFVFFAFGYVFLIASAIAGVAQATQVSWIWIALGAAGLHFLVALICLVVARSRMVKAPFPETFAELKKDREWLRSLDETTP